MSEYQSIHDADNETFIRWPQTAEHKRQRLEEIRARIANDSDDIAMLERELAELAEQERLANLFPARMVHEIGMHKKDEGMGYFAENVLGWAPGTRGYESMMYLADNIDVSLEIYEDGSWKIVGFAWTNSDDSRHTLGTTFDFHEVRKKWPTAY